MGVHSINKRMSSVLYRVYDDLQHEGTGIVLLNLLGRCYSFSFMRSDVPERIFCSDMSFLIRINDNIILLCHAHTQGVSSSKMKISEDLFLLF